jgi:hypothetical protein
MTLLLHVLAYPGHFREVINKGTCSYGQKHYNCADIEQKYMCYVNDMMNYLQLGAGYVTLFLS